MAWLVPRVGSEYVRDMNINPIRGTNIQENVARFNDLLNSISAEKRKEEMHPLDLAFMEAKNRSLNLDNDQAEYGFNRLKRANNEFEDATGRMRETSNFLYDDDKRRLNNEYTEIQNLINRFNYDETKRAYDDFEKNFGVNPNYFALSNGARLMGGNPSNPQNFNGSITVDANGNITYTANPQPNTATAINKSNTPSVINEDFIKDWNDKLSVAGVPNDPKVRSWIMNTFERESNFNPLAKSSKGSAFGLGQITDNTKAGLERLYPELKLDRNKYNAGNTNEQIRYANALYNDTAKTLIKIGIEPTDEAMNLAWFFGPAKAKAMIQDPNSFQDMQTFLGDKAYNWNKNYLSDDKGNPLTRSQVKEKYNKDNTARIEKYYNYYKSQGFTNKEAKEMAKEDVKADNQAEAQSMEQFSNYLFNPNTSFNPIVDQYKQEILDSLTAYNNNKDKQMSTPSSSQQEINAIPNDNQLSTQQEVDNIAMLKNALNKNNTSPIDKEKQNEAWKDFFNPNQQPISSANQEDINMLKTSLNPQQKSVVFRDDYEPINNPEQFITNAYNQQQEAKKHSNLGLRVGVDTDANDSDYVAISDLKKGNIIYNLGELRKKYPYIKDVVDIPGIGKTIKGYLTADDLRQGKHFNNKYLKDNNYKIYNLDGTITDLGNYAENINNTKNSFVSNEEKVKNFYGDIADNQKLSEDNKANLITQDVIRHNNIFWSLQGKDENGNVKLDEDFANAISSNIESQGRFLAMANIIGEDNLRRLSRNPEMLKALREFVTVDFGSKNYKQVKENILKKYNIANMLGYKENFAPLLDAIGESGKEYLHFLMEKEKISQEDIDNMRNVSPLTKIGNGKQSIELFNGYIPYKTDSNGKQTSERDIGKHSYMAGLNLDILGDSKAMKDFSQLNYDRVKENKTKELNKQQYLSNNIKEEDYPIAYKTQLDAEAFKDYLSMDESEQTKYRHKYSADPSSFFDFRHSFEGKRKDTKEADQIMAHYNIPKIKNIGGNGVLNPKSEQDFEKYVPRDFYENNKKELSDTFPSYLDYAIFMIRFGQEAS